MTLNPTPAAPSTRPGEALSVLVVDDSAVIRGLVTRWLEAAGDLQVVGSAGNGLQAVQAASKHRPDVVILDIEMPVMDGMAALPLILKASPRSRIVMASTLTRRNAEISLRALSLGAAGYLPKPEAARSMTSGDAYRSELVETVRALGRAARRRDPEAAVPSASAPTATPVRPTLRAASRAPVQVLGIGSSTGGPQALFDLTRGLAARLAVPLVITQHMPPTFTSILAEHITKSSGLPAQEGQTGMVLAPGRVYVAPGDRHMLIVRQGGQAVIQLSDAPPENYCRPAVDPMFRSLAAAFGAGVLGVILTGMGADGREGGRAVVAAGGTILAQDEASSVVWGMPGAVAQAGLCAGIHPLGRMAQEILTLMGRA